jgi:hypothetical protein
MWKFLQDELENAKKEVSWPFLIPVAGLTFAGRATRR